MTDPQQPPNEPTRPTGPTRPARAGRWRTIAFGLLVNTVLPLILYDQIQHRVGSQTTALVIAGGIPLLWTVGEFVIRRRVNPIGLLSVAGFAVGLLLVVVFGGGAFVFKIREPVLTGALGVLCLGSILIRRPAALLAMRNTRPDVSGRARYVAAVWITAIAGITLLLHGAVVILLAATLPTSTFLAVHQLVGWAIIGLGVLCLVWRKQRRPAAPAPEDTRPGGQDR